MKRYRKPVGGTCRVHVEPLNLTLNCRVGENLGYVLYKHGVLSLPCRGRGLCGRCMVVVVGEASKPTGNEVKHVDVDRYRLACQTVVLGDVKVEIVPPPSKPAPVLESFNIRTALNPEVKVEIVRDGKNVWWGGEVLVRNLDLNSRVYGVGLDIGTSKIACYLVDLEVGEVVSSKYTLNPQLRYGLDIISRVELAIKNWRVYSEMRRELLRAVEELVESSIGVGDFVGELVAVGNTVMTCMLLNLDLEGISRYPYTSKIDRYVFKGGELGFRKLKSSKVKIVPPVGGFVGGDAVSTLGVSLELKPKLPILVLDIGSNVEVALALEDEVLFTSAPAGPAIEGHVSSGILGVEGGISKVKIVGVDSESISFEFEVIGGGEPLGLTGSGLTSLICELKRWGILSSDGRILTHYEKVGGVKTLKIWGGEGREIRLTQLDVREFQKAKAAISACWKILLKNKGLKVEDLGEVHVAGVFGSSLHPEDMVELGMIPPVGRGDVVFTGNAAGLGACLSVLNVEFYEKLASLSRKAKYLNLALDREFQKTWVESLKLE